MHNYIIIFLNSFYASLLLSLRSEVAWFSALGFGGYDMRLATIMALAGSTLGMSINFVLGYGLSFVRLGRFRLDGTVYARACGYFRRYFLLWLLFPWIPFISLLALAAGLFRVSPIMVFVIIVVGRVGYYSYYLSQP